jgi:hypothetical protein
LKKGQNQIILEKLLERYSIAGSSKESNKNCKFFIKYLFIIFKIKNYILDSTSINFFQKSKPSHNKGQSSVFLYEDKEKHRIRNYS